MGKGRLLYNFNIRHLNIKIARKLFTAGFIFNVIFTVKIYLKIVLFYKWCKMYLSFLTS